MSVVKPPLFFWIGEWYLYIRSENTSEEIADYTANTVHGKNIKSIIDANEELELGCKVAASAAHDANDYCAPGRHEACGGRDGDEAGDGTGAEANGAPFLLEAVVEENPDNTGAAGGEMRDVASYQGADVHCQDRAAVEAEPADPEEDGAEEDVGDAVRTVGKAVVSAISGTLAEH